MIELTPHEEPMKCAEGWLALQEQYVHVGGVVHKFFGWNCQFIPKIIVPFAYLLVGL